MANLIYGAISSLDGYVSDERGNFDWAFPDDEVHAFINELQRPIGTYLYGRRLYETMAVWETLEAPQASVFAEYAKIWRSADKIVYSTTLVSASTAKTRLARTFDVEAVARMKAESTPAINMGGPRLAAQAFAAGLVDECWLFIVPVIVGGGNRALPVGMRVNLNLVDTRGFSNGFTFLHYSVHR